MADKDLRKADATSILIPLKMPVGDRSYKVLVNQQDIPFIASNRVLITNFLMKNYPNTSDTDPIYVDMDLVRNPHTTVTHPTPISCSSQSRASTNPSPLACSSQSGPSTQTTPVSCSSQSGPSTQTTPVSCSSQSGPSSSRYDWGVGVTKKLLVTIKSKSAKFEEAKNKRSVWSTIAKELGINHITGDKCRERYYTLKKAYRKFVEDSKKTGNKRPKPFIYTELMADIVQDDPTFIPVAAKGTLVSPMESDADESDDNGSVQQKKKKKSQPEDADESDDNGSVQPKKKKKSQLEELKEYMQERDERFIQALGSMNEKQNKLIEKLIEKL